MRQKNLAGVLMNDSINELFYIAEKAKKVNDFQNLNVKVCTHLLKAWEKLQRIFQMAEKTAVNDSPSAMAMVAGMYEFKLGTK